MTALLKPPSEPEDAPRVVDLVTIGPETDPFWQQVRDHQIAFVDRYMPWAVPIALINGAIVFASLMPYVDPWALGYLLVAQLGTMVTASLRAIASARAGGTVPISRARMRRILLEMLLTGAAWGIVFAQALGRIDPAASMLVVAMTMTGVACMAFAAAVFPLGAMALSGPIILGTLWGLARNDWGEVWMVEIVLATFLLFVMRGNTLTAYAFLSRLRTQQRLADQEQMIRLLLNEFEANGSEWLFEFDQAGNLTFVSNRFAEAARRPVEEVLGKHWTFFLTDRDSARQLFDVTRNAQAYRDLLLRVDVDGETRWWSLSGTPKFDRHGTLVGYRGVGSDVTERQRSQQRIAELATFDSLTGLVNRRVIHHALSDGLQSTSGVALLFVDLDRFKAVNDSLGHGAGDRLLVEVAARLRSLVADEGSGVVGRLGGDEFAIVLPSGDTDAALAVGEAIITEVSKPYLIAGKQAIIGASVGLAIGPRDGGTVEALMRAADLALYDVKGKGRGSVRPFDRALHRAAEGRRSLELDLRSALDAGQMWLAFQPVVDAIDERIVGFEALMRWRHPTEGDISPGVFIPIAEEAGIINRLGAWALTEACRVAAGWPRHIKLAVNLSPMQFDDPGLVDMVRSTLARFNLKPERLELELTESLFLDERAQTTAMLEELLRMGVGFALDDFGTGYSSLGYLQKIAFNRIKIDRSFVRASVAQGGESTAIIQAIVALADRLGMETTAEGTETRAEFEAMRRLGCAQVQGYYFGRPMTSADAARLIDRSRPLLELCEPEAAAS